MKLVATVSDSADSFAAFYVSTDVPGGWNASETRSILRDFGQALGIALAERLGRPHPLGIVIEVVP